ncbi:MAG: hypothetical protein ACTSU7_00015 [Candidatus Heimdallarchaeaceae archaeon]
MINTLGNGLNVQTQSVRKNSKEELGLLTGGSYHHPLDHVMQKLAIENAVLNIQIHIIGKR